MSRRATAPLPRLDRGRVVGRAMLVYLLLGLVVLVASGLDTYLAARSVARTDALHDASRSGRIVADLMVRPVLDGLYDLDPDAMRELDEIVDARMSDGWLARVRIWRSTGELVYADDHRLVGRTLPLPANARKVITGGDTIAQFCPPKPGTPCGTRTLIDVYVPLQIDTADTDDTADTSTRMALEVYIGQSGVRAQTESLTRKLVLLIAVVLIALEVAQVPIAYTLARSVSRHQHERGELLQRALSASERERRRIAQDLHDGVIQGLAGASYALAAVEKSLPEQRRELVTRVGAALQDAVSALRAVMVDIYPPDLSGAGLWHAVEDLAEPLRAAGLRVRSSVEQAEGLPAPVVATLYRFARETLGNVAAHAHATRVEVVLRREPAAVVLSVEDDGVGLPATGIDRRAEGHLGLRLIADAVGELGGTFEAGNRPGGGASIRAWIPLTGWPVDAQDGDAGEGGRAGSVDPGFGPAG